MNAYKNLLKNGPLEGAKMMDLHENSGWFRFRVTGDDEFYEAIQAVKDAFRWGTERKFDSVEKEWYVTATPENEVKLCNIFRNARESFRNMHSQLEMF